MNRMNKELYKKLLIPAKYKPIKRNKEVIKITTSPLITNFEKWSGKKIKIKRDQIEPIRLQENIFARILASPVRFDRISKTRLPNLLLSQVSLDMKNKKISLDQMKRPIGQHSYILNSLNLIHKNIKAPINVVPLHILSSNKINLSTLKMNISELLESHRAEVIEVLTKQLTELKPTPSSDVKLVYDKCNVKKTVFWEKDLNSNTVLCFNLSLLNNYESLHKAWKQDSITISSKESLNLLIQIYRALKFLEQT